MNKSSAFLSFYAIVISALLTLSSQSFAQEHRTQQSQQSAETCNEIQNIKPLPLELWCLKQVERGIFTDQFNCTSNGQSTYIAERKSIADAQEQCRIQALIKKVL
jgi:hypothetical protein